MIVIGIGARPRAGEEDILEVIEEALVALPAMPGLAGRRMSLATPDALPAVAVIEAAARTAGLPFRLVSREALLAAGARCETRSAHALAAYGVPSVAEAAALAVAGQNGRLAVTRIQTAYATAAIAIARSEEARTP